MEYEMEIEINADITVKVVFTPVKAEAMTRHSPGHPAHIEDLSVKSLVTTRIVRPVVYDWKGLIKREERVTPLNGDCPCCQELEFALISTMTDEEWTEECLEWASAEEDDDEYRGSRIKREDY